MFASTDHSAGELARRLAERAEQLAPELLPNGVRSGRYWRVGSLAGEPGQSLVVNLWGDKQGFWYDFSAAKGGDMLDLVAQTRGEGQLGAALDWARQWLSLPARAAPPPRHHNTARQGARPADDPNYTRSIVQVWAEDALPLTLEDPVARYLEGRAIDIAPLIGGAYGHRMSPLRFHPALPNSETGRAWPAMVAAISGGAELGGRVTAIHRTWLDIHDDGFVDKAPIPSREDRSGAKMTLGPYRGGAIRLWRGQSGKPWAEAPEDDTLMIGEGLEDTLSGIVAWPQWRAACAVALSSMLSLEVPPQIGRIVILGQNERAHRLRADKPVLPAPSVVQRAIERWRLEGRWVRVLYPSSFVKDWNERAQWNVAHGFAVTDGFVAPEE